jgi:hypothetical protein
MITKIPNEVKVDIIKGVKRKYDIDIEDDVIDFLQSFQSKVAVDKGFAIKKTVRFFNLAVFKYNEKKLDSRNTMKRLLVKHDGNVDVALKEFRELGIAVKEKYREDKRIELESRIIKPKKHEKIKSLDGRFTAR